MTAADRFARTALTMLRAVTTRRDSPEGYLGSESYELLDLYQKDIEQVGKQLLPELPDDWATALDTLRSLPVVEAKTLATDMAVRKRKQFEKSQWQLFSMWLDDCEGWALVDNLCCDLLSEFLLRWPELLDKTDNWARSKNLWKRRAALVILVRPARDGHFSAALFQRLEFLAADHDPMIYKAVSWALRSAITAERAKVERFLHDHSSVLKPVVIREVRTKLDTGRKSPTLRNTKANTPRQ